MAPNDLAVQAIATTALPSCTYNNGTGGVGATLTASSNGAFPAVDGYTAALNDALAINGQSTTTQNGLYTLTTVGDGSNPWVLTRRSPDDANIWTNPFCVLNGTEYANTVWCSETISSNVGTDSINFAQQAATINSLSDALKDSSNLVLGSKPTFSTGIDNTIVGVGASGGGGKQNNVVIGWNANANSGSYNVAIGGGGTNSSGDNAVAVGYGSSADSQGVCLGYGAFCGTGSINIGYGINASHTNAIGIGANPSGDNVVQIGNSSITTVYFGASGTSLGTNLALAGSPTTTTQSGGDNSTKIATTAYVDTAISVITTGLDARPSCRVATTAALTATYANGSSGVGATLTNSGTKSAISIDGVALSANDRVLVKNQSTAAQNGIYTVTTVGSGSVNWVLTRATDFNTASSTGVVEGAFTVIEEGTTQFGTFWIETGAGPFTIGTTAITFTQLQVTNVNLTNGHILVGNASNIATDVAMSGDVTISNTGATTIANNAVSNAKFRQSAGLSVVGNTGSSTANVADITGTANQVLVVNSAGTALAFGQVNLASASAVTGGLPLGNIATISNNTILGNNSGSTASPSALTAAQTKTLLAIANTDVSGLGTMSTQNASSVAITGGSITGMSTPVNGSDVATKSYVDASTAGLSAHTSCRVATTATLTATYSNGSSGVGATLTNSGTKAAISIDGVSLSANDRVLVKNQSTAAQNGIYTVTTVGSGSVNWVLTRATDFNTAAANGIVEGAYTVIEEGTANAGTLWIETGAGPFTVGTTAISFTELSVAPQTLTFTGNVTGTGSGSIALTIGASQVTNAMLAGSIAASNLIGTDIATVGTITSGTWNGTAITGSYIASSVALAGSPTTTTQSAGDNSTKIATTAYVDRAAASGGAATYQYLTSGSGATYTTPAGCKAIHVEAWGGGGGGGSDRSGTPQDGGTGGDTIFNSIHAAGGVGGKRGTTGNASQGGNGTTAGTGTATFRCIGAAGTNGPTNSGGGTGGATSLGGAGAGGINAGNGFAAAANSGSGGGGAGIGSSGGCAGAGGQAGEYFILDISSPSASYTYTIGAAGAGTTTSTWNGAAGGTGFIRVTEYY